MCAYVSGCACVLVDSGDNGVVLMAVLLGAVGLVLLLTLVIGAGLATVCLQQRKRKTSKVACST